MKKTLTKTIEIEEEVFACDICGDEILVQDMFIVSDNPAKRKIVFNNFFGFTFHRACITPLCKARGEEPKE